MDLRRAVIRSASDAEALHAQVLSGAERTATWLRGFAGSPLELLTALLIAGPTLMTGALIVALAQTCSLRACSH